MSEEEHKKIVNELSRVYVGKYTPDNTKIVCVYVDYRKENQIMNRVEDELGNIWFLEELGESYDKY